MSILPQLGIGLVAASALMTLVFIFCWRKQNFGYVDVAWSYAIGGLTLLYAATSSGELGARQWLAATLACAWSVRLGTHLLKRVTSEEEDGRYQDMRAAWSQNLGPRAFAFFQFQAIAACVMSVAPLLAMKNQSNFGSLWDWIALAVAVSALAGETISDYQLSVFRKKPENRGKTCRAGLWGWSRHPNYFFEWLYWCSFPFLVWGTNYFWLSLCSPLILLYLILKVTGIPPTEKNALRSRGDDYRRYQAETNAFLPWPRTRSKPSTQSTISS